MNQIELIAVIVGVLLSVICAGVIKYIDHLAASKVTPDDLVYEPLVGDTFTTARIGTNYNPESITRLNIDTV